MKYTEVESRMVVTRGREVGWNGRDINYKGTEGTVWGNLWGDETVHVVTMVADIQL